MGSHRRKLTLFSAVWFQHTQSKRRAQCYSKPPVVNNSVWIADIRIQHHSPSCSKCNDAAAALHSITPPRIGEEIPTNWRNKLAN